MRLAGCCSSARPECAARKGHLIRMPKFPSCSEPYPVSLGQLFIQSFFREGGTCGSSLKFLQSVSARQSNDAGKGGSRSSLIRVSPRNVKEAGSVGNTKSLGQSATSSPTIESGRTGNLINPHSRTTKRCREGGNGGSLVSQIPFSFSGC
jgi:hypothetical protein